MNRVSSFLPLILIAFPIFFIQKKSFSASQDLFWAHRFQVKAGIAYDTQSELQRLDLFLQGEWSGEPDYFRTLGSPRPTLIQIHGGGWISGDKADVTNWALPYVQKRWNVVNVNYRTGAGTAPAAIGDVICAIKWVVENARMYQLDTDKIVLSGFSSGAHLALIAGLNKNTQRAHRCYVGDRLRIRAIINWFGITDIERLERFLATNHKPNYALRWIGQKEKIKPFSEKYSPVHHVNSSSPAVMTIHGDKDSIVPYDQARSLHQAFDHNKVKNQLLTLQGGTHGGFTDAQYQKSFTMIFKFLDGVGIN